ncbi:MAG: hypothetical protein P4L87_19735 [Formivibrio sp.]|nr:hypothetical protein [Formivibrio sp.]
MTLHYGLYKDAPATTLQHLLETVAPFALALTFALVVEDVSILFSFVGAVARTSIAFIYPGAIVLSCRSLQPLSVWQRAGCWGLIVFGAIIMVCGLTATIKKVVS